MAWRTAERYVRADGDSWYTPAEDRCEIASAMAFSPIISDWLPELRLVADEPDDARDGRLDALDATRACHHASPVDDRGRAQDAAVLELQGSGNPSVTHPDLFDPVWP